VENTLNYCSVCRNKADLHPTQCLPMTFKSRLFLPLGLSHPDPETLPEREYEGRFFLKECYKNRKMVPDENT
jgi:hypothetical protein